MQTFSFGIATRLLLAALVFSLLSCNKDEMVEEMALNPASIELDKSTLLNELSDPNAINFFDLDFIELTNPHLSGAVTESDLAGPVEALHLDFLIKNGELDYVPGLIPEVGYPMWRRVLVTETIGEQGGKPDYPIC